MQPVAGPAASGNAVDVPELVSRLSDPDPLVRNSAGITLMNMASPTAAAALLDEIRSMNCRPTWQSAPPTDAASSLRAMKQWGQSPLVIIKKVLEKMAENDAAVRDLLVASLSEQAACVRYVAAYALDSSTDTAARTALETRAASGDVAVISGAYRQYLGTNDRQMRVGLIWGIYSFDDPDMILAMSRCGDTRIENAADYMMRIKGIDLKPGAQR
ncbi:MAG TPA: hypothetical protein ENK16_06610 [Chromatiales bacterium]|nr:hypothetical protein [Chromatiales bacterium]